MRTIDRVFIEALCCRARLERKRRLTIARSVRLVAHAQKPAFFVLTASSATGSAAHADSSHEKSHGEKRRYARHPGPFHAFCPRDYELRELRVINLGLGGCFVLGSSGHPVGRTFPMQVDLGAEGLMSVSATTLLHQSDGSAVTFMNLSLHALAQIARVVETVDRKPHERKE